MNFSQPKVTLSLLLFGIFIVGCSMGQSKPHIEGYILEVEENELLLAKNISSADYEEIKDTPINELHKGNLNLIYISYEDEIAFNKGNEIDIWLDRDIEASYPEKAKAKKIELKE